MCSLHLFGTVCYIPGNYFASFPFLSFPFLSFFLGSEPNLVFNTDDNITTMQIGREQVAINEFAEALLVIPKTLAVNAAQDASELVAKLRSLHYQSQNEENKKDLTMYVSHLSIIIIINLSITCFLTFIVLWQPLYYYFIGLVWI